MDGKYKRKTKAMIRSLDTLERETDRMILLRMDVSFIHGFVLRGVNWLNFEKKRKNKKL